MKKRIGLLVVALVMFVGISNTYAQKMGYINSEALVAQMPESKRVSSKIETLAKKFEKEYTRMVTQLQTKAQKYQSEVASQTEAVNKQRDTELKGLGQKLQQYQSKSAASINKKRFALVDPILKKAKLAIEKVAKAKGYNFVFDSKSLIYATGDDLMSAVKSELGIK